MKKALSLLLALLMLSAFVIIPVSAEGLPSADSYLSGYTGIDPSTIGAYSQYTETPPALDGIKEDVYSGYSKIKSDININTNGSYEMYFCNTKEDLYIYLDVRSDVEINDDSRVRILVDYLNTDNHAALWDNTSHDTADAGYNYKFRNKDLADGSGNGVRLEFNIKNGTFTWDYGWHVDKNFKAFNITKKNDGKGYILEVACPMDGTFESRLANSDVVIGLGCQVRLEKSTPQKAGKMLGYLDLAHFDFGGKTLNELKSLYDLYSSDDFTILPELKLSSPAGGTATVMNAGSFVADGKRGEGESWTSVPPTQVSYPNGDFNALVGSNSYQLNTWYSTDGEYLYIFMETTYTGTKQFFFLLDLANNDYGTGGTGGTYGSYTDSFYTGKTHANQSVFARFKVGAACDLFGNAPSGLWAAQGGTYTTGGDTKWKEGSGTNGEKTLEIKVALNDTVKAALQKGSYTIGAEGVAAFWTDTKVTSGSTTYSGSRYAYIGNSKMMNYTGSVTYLSKYAGLRDVVLPCVNTGSVLQGYQIRSGSTDSAYGVRFLATIQNLDYEEVGFEFTYNGKTAVRSCNTVYQSIIANNGARNVKAKEFGAEYLYGFTITGLDATLTDGYDFTIRTYSKALDGTVTWSAPVNVNVKNN